MKRIGFRTVGLVILAFAALAPAWGQVPAARAADTHSRPPERGLMVQKVYLQKETTVALRLKDGSKFRGRVSRVGKDEFDLQFLKRDRIKTRTVRVAEVKSLKLFYATERRDKILLGTGIATGGGLLTVIILALAGAL